MKKSSHLISAAVAVAATAAFSISASAQEQPASPSSSESPSSETTSATTSTGAKAEGTKEKDESGAKESSSSSESKGTQATKGGATGQLSSADRKFMMNAAKGGMMEVHMGQMAEKQGQSADVKKLGARMVTDHTKVNNELMTLAQAKGVKLDTRHKMDMMDGANFDQQWLAGMVKDHQKDIAEFQMESRSGTDAELKSFATKNLPTLQKHLQLVQKAQSKMGGSSGTNATSSPKPKGT